MTMRILILTCLLALPALSLASDAEKEDTRPIAERAKEQAERLVDPDAYLEELDVSVKMARDGNYGRMRRGDISRLEAARNRVAKLLQSQGSASGLSTETQIALYQDQETIARILRNNDKNRVVCTRGTQLGSRLPTTECLTVAQREDRARAARENTDRSQRTVCFAGEGNNCL